MKKFLSNSLVLALGLALLSTFSCDNEDDGPMFDVNFANTTLSFAENSGDVTAQVNLPGGAQSNAVTVNYSLGGSAVQGTDYNITGAGTLTIPANSITATITLSLIDNIDEDGEKTIDMTITSVSIDGTPVPQTGGGQSISIVISDDECSPYIAGTWNYSAIYFSFLPPGGDEIPADQGGQGLQPEKLEDGSANPSWTPGTPSIENPQFTGTIEISDSLNNRGYIISDATVGQLSGVGLMGAGTLLDNCGQLSVPDGEILLAGAFPVTFTGTINEDGTISVQWFYTLGDGSGNEVGRGEATLSK